MDRIKKDFLNIGSSVRLRERGITPICFSLVDSTNAEARRYAQDGGIAPALFVADEQSAGRGRLGRSFFSPASTGIYMTLLLDAASLFEDSAVYLTSAVSVAVAEAIEQVTGKHCLIKWVNDVYLDGRKVCGILAESFVAGGERYICIGVGVNLSTQDFPRELESIAGSLTNEHSQGVRREMTLTLATNIYDGIKRLNSGDISYIEQYRERSCVLGQRVSFVRDGMAGEGFARSIDERGALEVVLDDGGVHVLNSGEITLRVKADGKSE
jgi:BirA family biotin operon repressor/biotin-[acetyl-CoA-carboxylase] ligase